MRECLENRKSASAAAAELSGTSLRPDGLLGSFSGVRPAALSSTSQKKNMALPASNGSNNTG
jgi:hypothetical protein